MENKQENQRTRPKGLIHEWPKFSKENKENAGKEINGKTQESGQSPQSPFYYTVTLGIKILKSRTSMTHN